PDASPMSRIDAFYLPEQDAMHLTEYNAETPAGAAYGDALTEAFFALPVMRPFLRRFDVRPLPSRHGVLHALLGAYAQWDGGGRRDQPVIRAVQSGAVCMVNPFRCKLLHKKASLAVLSDEQNVGLFSSDERRAIDAHIPWTRVVAERTTRHEGRTVDLLPFIIDRREQLVLKPNDAYGGAGIVLGWEGDTATWERAVRVALTEPFVVQERVPIPSEPFPS